MKQQYEPWFEPRPFVKDDVRATGKSQAEKPKNSDEQPAHSGVGMDSLMKRLNQDRGQ